MIYLVVFCASLFGIAALLLLRILLRHRTVRRMVRSMKGNFQNAEDRGAKLVEEKVVAKPRRNPRTSAIELQKVRSLLRSAEKEIALQNFDKAEHLFIQALTIHPDAADIQAH
ncbi:MAG TPA: hypothetical protein PKV72_03825, partial [Candidatus Peribacteria bacterium]|nr:hypothetical protein [Candidatus Peribacteria bacterium]